MPPSDGNSQETAWLNTLFASFILVQMSALQNNYSNIVSVRVHPGIETRRELGEASVRPFIGVAPDCGHGDPVAHVKEIRLIFRPRIVASP